MNSYIIQGLVLTSQILIVFAIFTQYLRIISSKTIKGLSGWSYTLSTGAVMAWTVYGYNRGLVVYYVAHAITTLLSFSILSHLYSISKEKRKMEFYAFISGLILAVIFLYSPEYSGWVGLVYTNLARIPQYVHVVKDKNLKGISALSNLLLVLSSICTVLYAHYYKMLPLVISSSITIFSSIFVMFMVVKKSLRAYN